ncbi:diguanylate cyclase [Marinobacter sp. CA1]|nr:diguanylate cyclase [Marinobacter sp. CA1]
MPMLDVLRTLILLACLLPVSIAQAQPGGVDLDQGWQYRWGDSPRTDRGQPLWALGDDGATTDLADRWQAIGFPSNPPGRAGRTNAWFRVTLPATPMSDPVLYIYSVDLIVEVYAGGERIYQYGTFDEEGQGRFEGWPWHMVALAREHLGQPLYFRVFSNYSDIGLWGEVKLFERSELSLYILDRSLDALVVGGFSLLIALLALVFALVQTEKRSFASIALFSLAVSVMLLAESQAGQLLWNRPLVWDYLAAGAYYLIPVAIALLLSQWLEDTRMRVIRWIWRGHLAYVVLALSVSLLGWVNLSSTFPVFDALYLVSSLVLFATVLPRFRHVNGEQRTILVCYALLTGLLLVDMAVAHGFLPWGRVPVSWGALVFAIAIVMISLWHYTRIQTALRNLNRELEHKVSERTASLESLARREQIRAHQLMLENERTRRLNDLIAELQDCCSLKEGVGLFSSRLPTLCQPLHGRFYGRLEQDCTFELLCRWGDTQAGLDQAFPSLLPPATRMLLSPNEQQASVAAVDAGSNGAPTLPWCLHLRLQKTERGSFVAGALMLDAPDVTRSDPHFHPIKLFLALEHALQNLALTLSTVGLREELEAYSYEDALTGLKNRRFFDGILRHEIAMARRHELPLSVLVIDIDFFKRFNDRYGHQAGDAALKAVAAALMEETRDSDVICRIGGEEFVVILPGAAELPALDRAELLRRSVSERVIEVEGQTLRGLTVSIGVASWPGTIDSPEQLVRVADEALYKAKQQGRNCVAA